MDHLLRGPGAARRAVLRASSSSSSCSPSRSSTTTTRTDRPHDGLCRQGLQASLAMGLGSVVVNVGRARGRAGRLHRPVCRDAPSPRPARLVDVGRSRSSLVDLLWYSYHRSSHRVRVLWAMHQAHHSSVHFNYTTALRQKWNPWGELLFWVPLPLLGMPPWMIFFVFSLNLIYQFWVHTETHPQAVAADRARLQHAVAPPRAPRQRRRVPRPQLRRHPHRLGPAVRHLPRGAAAADLRADPPGRPPTTRSGCSTPSSRRCSARSEQARRWRDRLGYVFAPPGWSPESLRPTGRPCARAVLEPQSTSGSRRSRPRGSGHRQHRAVAA